MKTKKFIEEVEKLGFEVIKNSSFNYLIVDKNNVLISVSKTNINVLETDYIEFSYLNNDVKNKLFDLAVQFAKTPIKERKEQRKYYLRNKMISGVYNYLNASKVNIFKFYFNDIIETDYFKTKLTDEEIKKLSKIIKLENFEEVEVTDDE